MGAGAAVCKRFYACFEQVLLGSIREFVPMTWLGVFFSSFCIWLKIVLSAVNPNRLIAHILLMFQSH